MKKVLFFLAVLFFAANLFAQNGNDRISYQAVVRNSDNRLVYNENLTVTVTITNVPDGPVVYSETHAVTSNATGHVTLTETGIEAVTEIGLCWGTTSDPTISDNHAAATGTELNTEYMVNMEGLASGTNYYVRGYALSGNDYYYGDNVELQAYVTPIVTTGTVTAATTNTATSHVTLTDAGTGPVTEIGICWSTSSTPTISDNHAAAAGQTEGTEYVVNNTGLTSGTLYYVRGYAKIGNDYYYASNSRKLMLVNSLSDWNTLASVVNNGTAATVQAFQTANISGVTTVIGNSENKPFKGTYNGQGYAISNVSISGGDHRGLFGVVNSASAVIENVVVASGTVSCTGRNVGAIVGQVNSGTVRYCANYAQVSTTYNDQARIGGIVGWLRSAGGINNHLEYSINYGAVNGKGYVGGIVGSLGGGYMLSIAKTTVLSQQQALLQLE